MCRSRHYHRYPTTIEDRSEVIDSSRAEAHSVRSANGSSADAVLRASDAERDATATELRRHATAGRLSVDELEQRVEKALAARTRGDLDALLTDLPRSSRRAYVPVRRSHPVHWRSFVVVNLVLIAIWALAGFGPFWPGWVLLWWGLGIALHARRGPRRWRHEPL